MTVLSYLRRLFRVGNIVYLALTLLFVYMGIHCYGILFVEGHSMDPSLFDGQILMSVKVNNIPFLEVSRGDVVTINCPEVDQIICKRVIGLPGDRLQLVGGQLYINGQLYHEPYIYEPMYDCALNNTELLTVPENHYFVMGDNRNQSYDSRMIGFVSKSQLLHSIYPQHQFLLTVGFIVHLCFMCFLPICISSIIDRCINALTAHKKQADDKPAECTAMCNTCLHFTDCFCQQS